MISPFEPEYRLAQISYAHGIPPSEIIKLFDSQKHKCAICGMELELLKDTRLDHSHRTGKIRGILCNGCNIKVGNYEKKRKVKKEWLSKYNTVLSKYLEEDNQTVLNLFFRLYDAPYFVAMQNWAASLPKATMEEEQEYKSRIK